MKNLIAASLFGSVLGGLAMPALHGPIHFQVTKPYSMHGMLVLNPGTNFHSVVRGQAPMDYVITDVVLNGLHYGEVYVTANGARIANLGGFNLGSQIVESLHLNTGIPVAVGSVIGVESTSSVGPTPVTVCGYVQ